MFFHPQDYKCTARAPPRNKKEEDGSGPSVQKEDEAEVEDGASEEGLFDNKGMGSMGSAVGFTDKGVDLRHWC